MKLLHFEQPDPHLRELWLLIEGDQSRWSAPVAFTTLFFRNSQSTLTAQGNGQQLSTPFVAPCSSTRRTVLETTKPVAAPTRLQHSLACGDQQRVHRCVRTLSCEEDLQLRSFVSRESFSLRRHSRGILPHQSYQLCLQAEIETGII